MSIREPERLQNAPYSWCPVFPRFWGKEIKELQGTRRHSEMLDLHGFASFLLVVKEPVMKFCNGFWLGHIARSNLNTQALDLDNAK